MFCISSGYPGQAIKLNCVCSSRSAVLDSIAALSASTTTLRCALCPKNGTSSESLPLALTQAATTDAGVGSADSAVLLNDLTL